LEEDQVKDLYGDLERELDFATSEFPPMNSAHEGYAVLLEEVDELWDHVKAKQKSRDIVGMKKEAIQVAAMALRFVNDCCLPTGAGYKK
jgi:hypothetical protein